MVSTAATHMVVYQKFRGPITLWPLSTVGMRLLFAVSRRTAEMIGRMQKIEKMHVRHEKLWECGTSTRHVRSSSNLFHLLRSRSSIDCVFGWVFTKTMWGVIIEETLSLIPAVYGTSARFFAAQDFFHPSDHLCSPSWAKRSCTPTVLNGHTAIRPRTFWDVEQSGWRNGNYLPTQ